MPVNTTGVDFVPVNKAGDTMTGYLVLNADPVTALEAATKQYADAIAAGFTVKEACVCATTANLNAVQAGAGAGATLTNAGVMAAFSSDGVSPSVNDRVLVKDQTLTQHNGIYNLTTVGSGAVNWVLTRATDYDDAAEIQPGTLIPVTSGNLYAQSSWIETATVVTVDTDPIIFAQFTASPNTFAVTGLTNLAGVAINANLTADGDLTRDLGSSALRWSTGYIENIATGINAGKLVALQAYNTGTFSYDDLFTLTAGSPPTAVLASSVTATTQAPNDNSTKLATTAYVDASAATGANVHLSNLAAVAVNTALLSALDSSIDFGDATNRWVSMYGLHYRTGQSAGHAFTLDAYDTTSFGYTTFATLTAGLVPTMSLSGSVTSVTQAASDNSTKLATTAYADNQVSTIAANKALSNLSGVAINTSLVSDTDITDNLGTQAIRWDTVYTENVATGDTGGDILALQGYNTNTFAYSDFLTITAGNPPTAALASSVTGTTQAPNDNSTKLATTAYVDASAAAGANTALSNLAAVSINTSLLPGADNTIDLGDGTHRFRELYGSRVSPGSVGGNTLILSARNVGGASDTTFITLTSDAATPTCALAGAVTGVTQSASDNSTKLATTAYADNQVSTIAANKALSNLASVSINTDLLGSADNSRSLGSGTIRFKDTFTGTIKTGTGAGNTTLLEAYDPVGLTYTTFATLTANTPPTMSLAGAVTGTTQAASDNSTKLATTAYVDNQVSTIGANKALSNLSSVAINTALLPGADNTIDLGDGTHRFRELYGSRVAPGTTGGDTLILSARNVGGSSDTAFITLTSDATTPTCVIASSVTGTTQAASDNSTKLATTAYVDSAVSTAVPNPLTLAKGGTNANLTASDGGIFYSTSTAGAILSGTATARQMLQSGSSTAPAWSTATWPATTTANRILYSSATNTVGEITSANSAVLVTNSSGVPAFTGSATNGQLVVGNTGGTPTLATLTAGTNVTITNGAGSITVAQSAGGSGALTFIASSSTAGAASINFDNQLTSTYDNYMVVFENVLPATNAVTFQMLVGTGAGPTYSTSTYEGYNTQANGAGVSLAVSSTAACNLTLTSRMSNTASTGSGGSIIVNNVNDASNYKTMSSIFCYKDSTAGTAGQATMGVQWKTTTALTSLKFQMSSGNISGTIKLYGIQNS